MEVPQTEMRTGPVREAHLRDYWKILWQGRWSILAVFFLIVAGTAVYTFLQVPVYRSTATVEIQPQARRLAAGQDVSGLGAAGYGWFAEEKYHNTQVEIIKSRDISQRVAEKLSLWSHPEFEDQEDIVDSFRKRIQVDPRRDTGLIEISLAGIDPVQITEWANAIANAYVERNYEEAMENMTDSVEAIRGQLDSLRDELLEAETRRVTTLEEKKIYNSANQEAILAQSLQSYNSELSDVQILRNKLEQTLAKVEELQLSGGDLLSIPELALDETIRELHRNKTGLERDLESAKVELLPGHPVYDKKVKELARLESRIQEKTSEILGGLQNQLESSKFQERNLRARIDQTKQSSLDIAKRTSEYDVVRIDAETRKTIFDLVTQAMSEVQLGAQLMTNNVSVLDEAMVPRYPIAPRKRLNLALGVFIGLLLGVTLAFFLDYLDNTYRTAEDIEKYLQLSVLGVIPKLQEQGLAHRAVKEAYNSLRTSIIFSSKNRQRKAILITSIGPQEGKSSTTANLGRTLAHSGDRVIILDCDLRRPTQHFIHELERDSGLTNYLAAPEDQADWRPFTKQTEAQNLDVMPCGPIPPNPAELLGSPRFRELLEELRESYEWILVDSPPASSLADAPVLAELADMIVLVVKHNATDRDMVAKGLQRLRAVNSVIAGAVLNSVDISRAYHKDYYYSGYYYLSAEDKEKADRKPRSGSKAKVG